MSKPTYLIIKDAGFAYRLKDANGDVVGIMLQTFEAKEGKSLGSVDDLEDEKVRAAALKSVQGDFTATGLTIEMLTAAEWEAEKAADAAQEAAERDVLADEDALNQDGDLGCDFCDAPSMDDCECELDDEIEGVIDDGDDFEERV